MSHIISNESNSNRLTKALLFAFIALLSACNFPSAVSTPSLEDIDSAEQAAATLAARLTEVAANMNKNPTATPTLFPSTAAPTVTPSATVPPTKPPTPTPYPCNWAAFVSDVTIPDGRVLKPGEQFEKTWRLKNIGSCSWSKDYDLVFASGDRMDGSKSVSLTGTVKPGQTVDVSVDLIAPDAIDDYVGYWALRDASGRIFGIGLDADAAFWVAIEVDSPDRMVYDFTEHYCEADWRSGDGFLACPGDPGDSVGFVVLVEEPLLEGGRLENEPGLWVQLDADDDAWVTGEFPAFKVKKGDEFRTIVSCLAESPDCFVRFRLEYRIDGNAVKTFRKWDEKSEGKFRKVRLDLSDLAGEEVEFILTVQAMESSEDNAALWLLPSIWR